MSSTATATATRGPGHRYPSKVRTRARLLYTRYKWPQARISRHLDVPVDTLRGWLREALPEAGNARRYDRAAILAEAASGASRKELLERHGCSGRFLSDLLAGKIRP